MATEKYMGVRRSLRGVQREYMGVRGSTKGVQESRFSPLEVSRVRILMVRVKAINGVLHVFNRRGREMV